MICVGSPSHVRPKPPDGFRRDREPQIRTTCNPDKFTSGRLAAFLRWGLVTSRVELVTYAAICIAAALLHVPAAVGASTSGAAATAVRFFFQGSLCCATRDETPTTTTAVRPVHHTRSHTAVTQRGNTYNRHFRFSSEKQPPPIAFTFTLAAVSHGLFSLFCTRLALVRRESLPWNSSCRPPPSPVCWPSKPCSCSASWTWTGPRSGPRIARSSCPSSSSVSPSSSSPSRCPISSRNSRMPWARVSTSTYHTIYIPTARAALLREAIAKSSKQFFIAIYRPRDINVYSVLWLDPRTSRISARILMPSRPSIF